MYSDIDSWSSTTGSWHASLYAMTGVLSARAVQPYVHVQMTMTIRRLPVDLENIHPGMVYERRAATGRCELEICPGRWPDGSNV